MNPAERRRLLNDPRREAVDSLDGYAFQIWHSLLAWLQLREEELLYLEGAEDVDVLRPGTATATTLQIRRVHGSITLNSPRAVAAINHFWEHVDRNPETSITYRYLSTETISAEQPPIDGLFVPGLAAWRNAHLQDASGREAGVIAIANHLASNEGICPDLRAFLRTASPTEIYQGLISRVTWEVGAAESADIRSTVERAVGELGRGLGFSGPQSLQAVPRLLVRTLEAARNRDPNLRWLDRGELLDVFEQSTMVPEGSLHQLPPLPPRYYHRSSLYQELRVSLDSGSVLLLVGSSGVGKTATAVDYALRSGQQWLRLDMRGRAPSEINHLLRVSMRTMPTDGRNILIDDLPFDGDVRLYGWELSRFLDAVITAGGNLIISSYNQLPAILHSSLRGYSIATIAIPMFTEGDTAGLLMQVGAIQQISRPWSRIIEATTGGHPTLVDARVQSLQERGFPAPTANDLLEQPQAAQNVLAQARSIIATTLPMPARTLLYRLSVATHPLRRPQIVALGTATISSDPAIPHPGEVADRLVGPWLEPFRSERWRVSPLALHSGQAAHDSDWLREANSSVARALLVESPIDVYDGAAAVLHCLLGEDAETLLQILESFLRAEDAFWQVLNQYQPMFSAIAINTPPLPILGNVLVATLFRTAQYRATAAADDATAAGLIVEAFESAIPDDDYHAPLRLIFYSTVCGFPAEPAVTLLQRVLIWLASVERSSRSDNEIALAMVAALRDSADEGDVPGQAGVLLLSRAESLEDFRGLLEALRGVTPAVTRSLFVRLEDEPALWRAVVYTLIVDQRSRDNPDYRELAAAFWQFHELCIEVGSRTMALEALSASIRVSAEFAEDSESARRGVERGAELFGDVPRLRLAEAASAHAAGNRERAVELFRSALGELEYPAGDLEPAFDRRAAAIDAGALDLFDVASELLEAGASYASIEAAPYLNVGLTFDASYAAWRSGQDVAALRLARIGGDGILSLDPTADETAYRNLTRRVGHVISHVARGPSSLVSPQTLPFVGYASELEPLEDEPVTPVEIIAVYVAELERRVADSPEWFQRHEESLFAATYPASAMALHIGAQWAMLTGDVSRFLHCVIPMHTQASEEMARRGGAAPPERTYIDLTGAALIGYIPSGGIDSETLQELSRIAREHELSALVSWLEIGVQYTNDFDNALAALRGEDRDDTHQFLASIVLATSEQLSPMLLLRANELWILHLAAGGEIYPFVDVILAAMRHTWHLVIANMRIHLISPMRTVPELTAALENEEGSKWDKVARIVRAAAEAIGVAPWPRTVQVLLEKSALYEAPP